MTTTTTDAAAVVDARHVTEVCRLATLATPYATRHSTHAIHHRADGSGVTIVVTTARIRTTAERALRRHGYRLAHVPPADPTAGAAADQIVRVTGWSPSGLARRVAELTRAVSSLERSLPATIAQAARAYALLHNDLDPTIALYGTAGAVRADLQARITRRIGPLPRRGPSARGVPEPVRHWLDISNDLTQRVSDLLTQHWNAAVRTAGRYAELAHRHTPATAQAKAIAEIRTAIRRQRQTDLFLDACAWADTHLGAAHIPAFAHWYIAEFGPTQSVFVPFPVAARRWHAHGHPPARTRPANHAAGTRTERSAPVHTTSGGTQ